MKTLTLAAIHESQGYASEAVKIYKEILAEDPGNEKARLGLERLTQKQASVTKTQSRKVFAGVNQKKKYFFVRMQKKEHFVQFERWLAASWN